MRAIPIRLASIVATLGPATSDEATLGRLIDAGMDVARLNLAHGTAAEHEEVLGALRRASESRGKFVAVLQDLAGPKVRLRTPGAVPVALARGQTLRLVRGVEAGGGGAVATTWPGIVDDCAEGESVLFGDGAVRTRVVRVEADALTLEAEDDGELADGMGVNLPETAVSAPSMTEKDWADLEWGIGHEVDYVGLSFVRRAEEVRAVKARLREAGSEARVIAKIEKREAVEAIDAILKEADGVMVARGDLGVEMDVARVPIVQKDVIRRAAEAGLPVITATQMLQSMVSSPSPTRAEVSDVANAVFDGSDALMLSGETAVGRYPVRAVEMMDHVIDLAEDYAVRADWPAPGGADERFVWTERAIVLGATRVAWDLDVALVVALTHSGETALLMSKQGIGVPILAISDRVDTCRRMALYRGVVACHHPEVIRQEDLVSSVERVALERKLVARGGTLLIISGQFPGRPGGADTLRVHTVAGVEEGKVE